MTQKNLSTGQSNFTLALHQHVPTPTDLETSIDRVRQAASEASARHAQLLLVPEASITGYNIPLPRAQSIALNRDGAIATELKLIARDHKIALAYLSLIHI